MPRVARRLSSSGIYHVMVRGINKQDIFLEYQDYRQYLTVMRRIKERSNCIVHCYCLMPNHVHLLLQIDGEDIGLVMKRIGSSYVRWYNNKYQRVGHLFQDRFLSKTVEEDSYFIKVLQYIHQNPVEGGLAPAVQLTFGAVTMITSRPKQQSSQDSSARPALLKCLMD